MFPFEGYFEKDIKICKKKSILIELMRNISNLVAFL